jgi:membrane-associated phospholipid phosphatase
MSRSFGPRADARAAPGLAGAAACVLLLVATWFLAFHVEFLRDADQRVFSGFFGLHTHRRIEPVARFLAGLCDPLPYVYLGLVPIVAAALRRRPGAALAACGILIGANLTTELLKPLLAEPRAASLLGGVSPVSPASWPSGHATAAMALALAAVVAAPTRIRPVVAALGAGFAMLVSYSFLALGWHYPSDVFGGFLVAAAWGLVGLAAMRASDRRAVMRPALAT